MNRRRLLASLGALMGGGILLEYLGLLTYLLNPCDAMHRIELRTVAVDSSQSPPDPLRFADLSDGEQDVVLTAIREGKYIDCIGSASSGVERFKERVRNRIDDSDMRVYLMRDDKHYSLYFKYGDLLLSTPE